MNNLIFFAIIILLNIIFILNFKKISSLINLNDEPNQIKTHKNKIPCFGGFIFLLNILLFIIFSLLIEYSTNIQFDYSHFFDEDFYSSTRAGISLIFISFMLFLLGVLDDKFKISANKKLFFQLFLCIFAILIDENLIINSIKFSNGYEIHLFKLAIIFTILCFLIFINAFNMFDGINNQASIYIFILCGYFLYKVPNLYLIYMIIIANSLFFYFNSQNKLFLGDNGSLLIGYIFANLLTKSHNLEKGVFADEILIIMFFPVMDLLRLFLKRVVLNKHPFSGDVNHLHHRLKERYGNKVTYFIVPISIILALLVYQFNNYFGLAAIFISYFILIMKSRKLK